MRVWTILSTKAFVSLNRDGVVCGDNSSDISINDLSWMIDMMKSRIHTSCPEEAKYPIWAVAQVGSYKKEYHPSDKEYTHERDVLLILDVPENEILLFDSDMWRSVLNGSMDGIETRESIFDLNYRSKRFPKMKRNKNIQGCMWQIRSEWVRGYRML